MKKKKLLSVLLASAMISQSFFGMGAFETQAAGNSNLVGHEQLTDKQTKAPEKDTVVPDANQYEYQKQELAAFCHFGPNTFNEIEWGEHYGTQTPDQIFRLSENFDADTFVKTIKDAGFKKLIVTAKHHDGFCIWNSQHTTYDVESTSYKNHNYDNMQGDILAEISAACTKENLDMGLYLSPWDIHDPSYGYKDKNGRPLVKKVGNQSVPVDNLTWDQVKQMDEKDYNKYYNDQLIEILSNEKYGNKGRFKEVWMDGAKGSGAGYQEYNFTEWFDTIQKYEGKPKYEADCLLFGAEAYTTVRWIGNEHGFANEETWSKSEVNKANNTINSNSRDGYTVGFENGNQWTVPEADARITSGWFWGNNKKTPKSLADLGEMYFRSVGHNAPLLLNIPPNNKGKVDVDILNRTREFGQNIRDTFKENLAANATVKASAVRGDDIAYSPMNVLDKKDDTYWTVNDGTTTGQLVLDLGGTKTFDVVSIEEAIKFGQRIKSFKIEYQNGNDGWKTFDQGTTIGAKRLSRKGTVIADQLRISVTTTSAVPMISEVGVYKATSAFELTGGAPNGMQVVDERDNSFTLSQGWTLENGQQYLNNTNMWAKKGASFEFKFHGSKVYLIGTLDSGHGTARVTVDGKPFDINTNSSTRATGQIIFTSEDLEDKDHVLKLEVTDTNRKAIGVEGAYVINNGGLGMVGVEKAAYTMNEDTEMKMKLVRVGGTTGEVTVKVEPNPGTAIQDDFDTEGITNVTFKDGEKEKEVVVITRRNTNKTGDQNFTEELSSTTPNAIIGFNKKATITILDKEGQPAEETVASTKVPRDSYATITATSQETSQADRKIENAFDEDLNTLWHAQYGEPGKLKNNQPQGISVEMTLKEEKELTKLTYLPNAGDTGTIGEYEISALDGAGAWKVVCTGAFKPQGTSATPQKAVFQTPVKTTKIKFTAKTMAGGDHPTARDIALYEVAKATTTQKEVTVNKDAVKASSEETVKAQQGIAKAFDNDPSTFWHANWDNGKIAQNPDGITVTIPVDETKTVTGMSYLPRTDRADAGTIGNFEIKALKATAADGTKMYELVHSGTFARQGSSKVAQEVKFNKPIPTSELLFVAKTMAGGDHPTAAEIKLFETVEVSNPEAAKVTVTVTAGENGTVTPVVGTLTDGKITIKPNQLKTFAIKPAKGYVVEDVKVNNKSVGAVTRYTVESATDVTIHATFKKCEHTNTELRDQIDATCNKAGYTGDTYCTDCGELVTSGTEIAKKPHTFGDWEIVTKPTEQATGSQKRVCSVCKYEETQVIDKLEPAVKITLTCTSSYDATKKIGTFIAARNVPAGVTVLEHGIIITDEMGYNAYGNDFSMESTRKIVRTANSKTNVGRYGIRLSKVKGTWYAKAYVKYRLANGTEGYFYSDYCKGILFQ